MQDYCAGKFFAAQQNFIGIRSKKPGHFETCCMLLIIDASFGSFADGSGLTKLTDECKKALTSIVMSDEAEPESYYYATQSQEP